MRHALALPRQRARALVGLGIGLAVVAALHGALGPVYGQTVPADDGSGYAGGCAIAPAFGGLDAQIPGTVGSCAAGAYYDANGNLVQPTTGGLLVYDPTTDTAAFTDGATTYEEGPNGLETYPNAPAPDAGQ